MKVISNALNLNQNEQLCELPSNIIPIKKITNEAINKFLLLSGKSKVELLLEK